MLEARRGAWWDANKIGLSSPPIQTDRGWLMLYHGVRHTPSGCLYRLGLALFDLESQTSACSAATSGSLVRKLTTSATATSTMSYSPAETPWTPMATQSMFITERLIVQSPWLAQAFALCWSGSTRMDNANVGRERRIYEALRRIVQFAFECHHCDLSRVFTIQNRTYQVCFECGRKLITRGSRCIRRSRTFLPTALHSWITDALHRHQSLDAQMHGKTARTERFVAHAARVRFMRHALAIVSVPWRLEPKPVGPNLALKR